MKKKLENNEKILIESIVYTPSNIVLSLISAVVVIFYVTIFMAAPLNGEDYALTKNFGHAGIPERIYWALQRSSTQITTWNARFGEQLAIFWLSMPKHYFAVFSTFCFIIFSFLTGRIFNPKENRVTSTFISLVMIFPLWPGYELFFWGTANAGYMQPLVLSLICAYFYSSDERLQILVEGKYAYIFLASVAFLAGLSFENVPLALIIFMLGSLTTSKQRVINLKSVAPILSISFGWVLLILAPSTVQRRNYYKNVYGVKNYTADYLLDRAQDVSKVFFNSSEYLFLATVILICFALRKYQEPRRLFILLFSCASVCISIIAAPYTEPRAFSFVWAIMFSICVAGISSFLEKIPNTYLNFLPFTMFLYFPIKAATFYTEFSSALNQRDYYIRSMDTTELCKKGLSVSSHLNYYPYKYLNNRDNWYIGNTIFVGSYYGCKVIVK